MSQLRGAIIGYGFIGSQGHLPAYRKRAETHGDFQILAIADTCAARRRVAEKEHPGARVYPDYLDLLEAESCRLDFVDICTPPSEHAAIAHAALERGLHVLCEKPLATSLADAKSLLGHARQAERVIFPCHNYKHAPVVIAVREIISKKIIGKICSVTLNTFRNTHARGVPEWNPHWRREKKYGGGGIAMDHGSHTFYLTFDWMGSYPQAVTAKVSTLGARTGATGGAKIFSDTEDNLTAVLSFPNGLAHTYLSWTAGVRKVIYTIQGEKGAITVDDDDLQLAVMTSSGWSMERKSISSDWMNASHVSWFAALFGEFKKAVINRDYVGKEASEALLCVQLIDAAYRSSRDGCREVTLMRE